MDYGSFRAPVTRYLPNTGAGAKTSTILFGPQGISTQTAWRIGSAIPAQAMHWGFCVGVGDLEMRAQDARGRAFPTISMGQKHDQAMRIRCHDLGR